MSDLAVDGERTQCLTIGMDELLTKLIAPQPLATAQRGLLPTTPDHSDQPSDHEGDQSDDLPTV